MPRGQSAPKRANTKRKLNGTSCGGRKKTKNEVPTWRSPVCIDSDDDIIITDVLSPDVSATCKPTGSSDVVGLLVDRCAPNDPSELAVNCKKVNEVRDCLLKFRSLSDRRSNKLLLLTGPTGCGKTATISVLCGQLGFELIEWNGIEQYELGRNEHGDEILFEQSQVTKFIEFLKRVERSLQFGNHQMQRVVLIEQLPYVFYREPGQLHTIIANIVMNTRAIYVFVLSTIDSCRLLTARNIFPPAVLSALRIQVISFNGCAITFLTRALRRITETLRVSATSAQLKRIAESSNGDVRNAINNLQLCASNNDRISDETPLHSSLFLDPFHCLGKLLYAKRSDKKDELWSKKEGLLSDQIRNFYIRDLPPKDDVNDVISKSGMAGDMLALFVHEHEPNFAISIDACWSVMNDLSEFDAATNSWESRMNVVKLEYEAQIAARTTFFHNFGSKSRSGKGLYLFHKPKWRAITSQAENLFTDARFAFPAHRELFQETLPMLPLIGIPINSNQRVVLESINFGFSRKGGFTFKYVDNSNSNTVSSLEVGDDEFEIEEVDENDF